MIFVRGLQGIMIQFISHGFYMKIIFFEYKDNIENKLVFSKCKSSDLLNLINSFLEEIN